MLRLTTLGSSENRNVLYRNQSGGPRVEKSGKDAPVGCGSDSSKMIRPKSTVTRSPTASNRRKEWWLNRLRKRGDEGDDLDRRRGHCWGDYDTILSSTAPPATSPIWKASTAKPTTPCSEGGRIILIDVPKESTYGVLYNLAKALGTWDHPLPAGTYP